MFWGWMGTFFAECLALRRSDAVQSCAGGGLDLSLAALAANAGLLHRAQCRGGWVWVHGGEFLGDGRGARAQGRINGHQRREDTKSSREGQSVCLDRITKMPKK